MCVYLSVVGIPIPCKGTKGPEWQVNEHPPVVPLIPKEQVGEFTANLSAVTNLVFWEGTDCSSSCAPLPARVDPGASATSSRGEPTPEAIPTSAEAEGSLEQGAPPIGLSWVPFPAPWGHSVPARPKPFHGAACSSAAIVSTAQLLFQPCWLQHHYSDTTKFPSPLPSLMHYLPPGTQDLNESSSSQLSKVQNMLFMEKQHTPEKQKVRDYLAAVYRLLRKSQQSTAKFK